MAVQQVSLLEDFISLFFPRLCLGCEQSLPRNLDYLCPSCQLALPRTDNHLIEVPSFTQKFSGLIAFEHVLVYMHFHKKGIVQRLMHELKYNHQKELGQMLGRWYGGKLQTDGFQNAFDCVVPVPLHKSKLRKRGYNQSEFFALGLAEAFGIPSLPNALERTRANETQTRKNRLERWQNVENLFIPAEPDNLKGKRVLLVDDVLTTGSTLLACGEAIWQAEAASLSFGLLAAAQ